MCFMHARSHNDLQQPHEVVLLGTREHVQGHVHTNVIESFWSVFKRGYVSIRHRFSTQQLDRYAKEYAGLRNLCELGSIEQMSQLLMQFWKLQMFWDILVQDSAKD